MRWLSIPGGVEDGADIVVADFASENDPGTQRRTTLARSGGTRTAHPWMPSPTPPTPARTISWQPGSL